MHFIHKKESGYFDRETEGEKAEVVLWCNMNAISSVRRNVFKWMRAHLLFSSCSAFSVLMIHVKHFLFSETISFSHLFFIRLLNWKECLWWHTDRMHSHFLHLSFTLSLFLIQHFSLLPRFNSSIFVAIRSSLITVQLCECAESASASASKAAAAATAAYQNSNNNIMHLLTAFTIFERGDEEEEEEKRRVNCKCNCHTPIRLPNRQYNVQNALRLYFSLSSLSSCFHSENVFFFSVFCVCVRFLSSRKSDVG